MAESRGANLYALWEVCDICDPPLGLVQNVYCNHERLTDCPRSNLLSIKHAKLVDSLLHFVDR